MTVAIEERLRSLGDVLDLTERDLVDDVLARIDEPPAPTARVPVVRVVAGLVFVMALAVAVIPSSRRAVADWFGFDGARIERRPVISVPATPDPLDRGAVGTVVVADGSQVLVSEFVGTLENPALTKIVGDGTSVVPVEVDGQLAVWIDGDPHEVSFTDRRGEVVFEGFAGNTLLWQDGPVIRRLEGFADVEAAIAYAESIGT